MSERIYMNGTTALQGLMLGTYDILIVKEGE
jgi:hypothetical protein